MATRSTTSWAWAIPSSGGLSPARRPPPEHPGRAAKGSGSPPPVGGGRPPAQDLHAPRRWSARHQETPARQPGAGGGIAARRQNRPDERPAYLLGRGDRPPAKGPPK